MPSSPFKQLLYVSIMNIASRVYAWRIPYLTFCSFIAMSLSLPLSERWRFYHYVTRYVPSFPSPFFFSSEKYLRASSRFSSAIVKYRNGHVQSPRGRFGLTADTAGVNVN